MLFLQYPLCDYRDNPVLSGTTYVICFFIVDNMSIPFMHVADTQFLNDPVNMPLLQHNKQPHPYIMKFTHIHTIIWAPNFFIRARNIPSHPNHTTTHILCHLIPTTNSSHKLLQEPTISTTNRSSTTHTIHSNSSIKLRLLKLHSQHQTFNTTISQLTSTFNPEDVYYPPI